jgi:iron(II)-dependent oxidoreductase
MVLQLFSRRPVGKKTRSKSSRPPAPEQDAFEPADPTPLDPDALHQCVQLERLGHLMANRHKWNDHREFEQICRSATQRLDEMFAIVPEGFATLPQAVNDQPDGLETTVETEPFLLARHAVTHGQYRKFVDAGGYDDLDLWPKDIWPHLIDFKDLTGQAGPRYWRNGRHNKPLADHPVVGVCYYECAAYARWAGYRLPTEAEWQMAATWRIRSAANVLRRYPWGDSLDLGRCNIWGSGIGKTAPVAEYALGAAPNQALQLVGNVWEWTACDFEVTDGEGGRVVGDMCMAAIRGGAFDTYFPSQATSIFRSGLVRMARSHNVGFRCVLDLGENGA